MFIINYLRDMTRVSIIDEHPISRIGINLILCDNIDDIAVSTYANFEELRKEKDIEKVDLLVFGLREYSIASHLLLLEDSHKLFPHIPKIVYGDDLWTESIINLLRKGARGVVSKRSLIEDFIACCESVLKGKYYINPALLEKLIGIQDCQEMNGKQMGRLTHKEFAVANYLISGVRPSNIARTMKLHRSAVSIHRKSIFKKLKVNNIFELNQVLVSKSL